MIRQFTFVPALLAGAAMIISACSAEIGGGGSDGSSSGSSSSGSSVSSSQSAGGSSSSQNSTGEFGSLSGKVDRVLEFFFYDGEVTQGTFLLEDGSIIDRNVVQGFEISPVDVKNIKHIPHYWHNSDSDHNVCALTHDSDVYCWGTNEYGQVGNGTYDSTVKGEYCKTNTFNGQEYTGCYGTHYFNAFKILSGVKNLISQDYGRTFCAVTMDYEEYCWGENNGFYAPEIKMVNKPVSLGFLPLGNLTPEEVTSALPAVAEKIVKIEDVYEDASCEITDSGKVTCQGYNSDEGMLFGKENKALPYSANPIEITGVEQAESFIPTYPGGFSSSYGVCVLRKDDKIQCWGDDAKGVITYTP